MDKPHHGQTRSFISIDGDIHFTRVGWHYNRASWNFNAGKLKVENQPYLSFVTETKSDWVFYRSTAEYFTFIPWKQVGLIQITPLMMQYDDRQMETDITLSINV